MSRYLVTLLIFCTATVSAIAEGYGHLHLTVTNASDAAKWYAKHFDGEVAGAHEKVDRRAMVSGIPILFFQKKAGFKGSVGSAVDHIGFSMEGIKAKAEAIEADGGKRLGGVLEFKGSEIAFVEDPWGTKIELIDDPETRGMHHIHLHSSDPEGTLKWYQNAFGGEITKFRDALPGIQYGQVWLFVQKSNKEFGPTRGRSIDHLGWDLPDIEAAAVDLKAKGVNFSLNPIPFGKVKIAFIDGPDGVNIELVQPSKE